MPELTTTETLRPPLRPVIVAGRQPFIHAEGDDINAFIAREHGRPLQMIHFGAYTTNLGFISSQEGRDVVTPPRPTPSIAEYENQPLFSLEPLHKSLPQRLPDLNVEKLAYYPQDYFVAGDTAVIFRNNYSFSYFSSLVRGREVLVDEQLGDGGRVVVGERIVFATYAQSTDQSHADSVFARVFPTKKHVRVPPPSTFGLKNINRATRRDYIDHIDQLISPDILVRDEKQGDFLIVPIDAEYLEAIRENAPDALLTHIEATTTENAKQLPIRYLPIVRGLTNLLDILNCPVSPDHIYVGPLLAKIVSLYSDAAPEERDHVVEGFQKALIAECVVDFPADGIWQQADDQARMIYLQRNIYLKLKGHFTHWREEAQRTFDRLGLKPTILPVELPSTPIYQAGMKCKTNFL